MARRRRDRIDPTERHPVGRRRFLQGAAATTAAAFPILHAGAARAGGGCNLYDTPASFMGVVPDPESVLGFPVGVDQEVTPAQANTYLQAVAAASDRVRDGVVGQSVEGRTIRYAIVGHPDNVTAGGLEAIRQANLEIRDPDTRQGRADDSRARRRPSPGSRRTCTARRRAGPTRRCSCSTSWPTATTAWSSASSTSW